MYIGTVLIEREDVNDPAITIMTKDHKYLINTTDEEQIHPFYVDFLKATKEYLNKNSKEWSPVDDVSENQFDSFDEQQEALSRHGFRQGSCETGIIVQVVDLKVD